MVRIEGWKSATYYARHCALCGKRIAATENRVKVTATWKDDSTTRVLMHEDCARSAMVQQGAEKVIEGGVPS